MAQGAHINNKQSSRASSEYPSASGTENPLADCRTAFPLLKFVALCDFGSKYFSFVFLAE